MFRAQSAYMDESYALDSAMIRMLSAVSILLIAITALGLVGLAAFNVNQRRKQIGTRRALGGNPQRHPPLFCYGNHGYRHNRLLTGSLLAFSLSWWMGTEFGLPPLDWHYLPPTIVSLLVISLIAVLGPARRASATQSRLLPPAAFEVRSRAGMRSHSWAKCFVNSRRKTIGTVFPCRRTGRGTRAQMPARCRQKEAPVNTHHCMMESQRQTCRARMTHDDHSRH